MKRFLVTVLASLFVTTAAHAAPAPDFTGTDSAGKVHKLSDYKGKVVVLEWFNAECPYVKKHYESGNMQQLQSAYKAKGVEWLTVNSSAEGKGGHMNAEETTAKMKEWKIDSSAFIIDAKGVIGKAYGAKTTPHMYVINKNGELAYQGAIDDNDSSSKSTIEGAKNYVAAALDEVLADKPVSVPSSAPYGCSVKYEN